MSIEAVQTILFPLVLILFWRGPLSAAYRVPGVALLGALVCWSLASLSIRGYLPEILSRDRIVLAELDGDSGEKSARELLRRYNVIAQAYTLPKMETLMRSFPNDGAASDWLKGRTDVHLLVGGTAEWMNVIFPTVQLEIAGSVVPPEALPAEVVDTARSYGVPLDRNMRVVRLRDAGAYFVLALTPDSLALPGEPSELSRHYLGWLAEGIGRAGDQPKKYGDPASPLGKSAEFSKVQLRGWREDALAQTCLMLGSWRSPEPIALARLLSGTYQLADALAETSANAESMFAAFTTLNSAQKMLRREQHPELMSLVRNNAAVARLFMAQKDEEILKARKELIVTATFTDSENRPTLGARVSMLNLVLLESAGLL